MNSSYKASHKAHTYLTLFVASVLKQYVDYYYELIYKNDFLYGRRRKDFTYELKYTWSSNGCKHPLNWKHKYFSIRVQTSLPKAVYGSSSNRACRKIITQNIRKLRSLSEFGNREFFAIRINRETPIWRDAAAETTLDQRRSICLHNVNEAGSWRKNGMVYGVRIELSFVRIKFDMWRCFV